MVNFIRPASIDEALDLIASSPMTLIAGATDQLIKTKALALTRPDFSHDVLFLGDLIELKKISIDQDKIILGSAVTFSELLAHPDLPDLIKRPCQDIASPAIRNLATIGGNLVNASPSGDALTMLYALDAKILIRSKLSGQREVPIDAFITGPKQTILNSNELVIAIVIPKPSFNRFVYRKVGARLANAITKVSFYGTARIESGTLIDLRLAFGAVGPRIVCDRSAEKAILKAEPMDRIDLALSLYDPLITPIDDVRSTKTYRKQVAMNLLKAFIEKELT